MLRALTVAVLLGMCLSACNTGGPNPLSAIEAAELRFTSLEVRVPDPAKINWGEVDDEFRRSRGLGTLTPLGDAAPAARAYVADRAAQRMKTVMDRIVAKRAAGTRPVKVVVRIIDLTIPSPLFRVVVGGHPSLNAEVDVIDARTNAVVMTYKGNSGGQQAGQGVGGVLLDAVMVEGGMDDLFDRTASGFAKGFERWLSVS